MGKSKGVKSWKKILSEEKHIPSATSLWYVTHGLLAVSEFFTLLWRAAELAGEQTTRNVPLSPVAQDQAQEAFLECWGPWEAQ